MADPRSRFTWDPVAHQYRDGAGRFVPRTTIRRVLEVALQAEQERAKALALQVRAGELTVDAFHLRMREMVKDSQLFAAALAKGGWAQLHPADLGRVGQRVRIQYTYLARLTGELEAGLKQDGAFVDRAASYARSARPTYQVTRRVDIREAGFDQARSLTHDVQTEHCDMCLAEEAKGWQPADEMVPIGERQCLGNDRCTAEYRNSVTGQVVAA